MLLCGLQDLETLDDAALKELYEMRVTGAFSCCCCSYFSLPLLTFCYYCVCPAEKRAEAGREDFSDMVAAKSAAQKRKATDKATGKEKKFKF